MSSFRTEAELCARFTEAALEHGWTVYPEQAEWDLLLVRSGIQVGVQAKLRGNIDVLAQAVPEKPGIGGSPHYRSVLVPDLSTTGRPRFYRVARSLRVLVFEHRKQVIKPFQWVDYDSHAVRVLSRWPLRRVLNLRHYRWGGTRVWVPPFVPEIEAGVPSPQAVGPWQIAACELEMLFIEHGFVTAIDAKEVTAEVGGTWNPKTLLSQYFTCTSELAEPGSRHRKWKPMPMPPSRVFPRVWEGYVRSRQP